LRGTKQSLCFTEKIGVLFSGIAALCVTFFLAVKKKVTKEKLPAAPASLNVSAATSGVVSEPDDAGFRALTGGAVLFSIRVSIRLSF